MTKLDKSFAKKGVPNLSYSEMSDEMKEKVWDLFNSKSREVDGVSLEDFLDVTEKLNTLTSDMQKKWAYKTAIV